MEGLLQTLASIAAMGTFVYEGLQKRKAPLRPKVFFIGTHKDQLKKEEADMHISCLDEKLQTEIKSTSHYKDLVEFASPSQLIFTVNNFSEDDSDFRSIRLAVEQVIMREKFHMTSPAHWLIYSLAIRKLQSPVVSYDICLEVAKQCGIMSKKELSEALHFIHTKMGLVRYFPYEGIKDKVVIHPQFLFNKVTDLIVDTFTFERAGKQLMEEFKKQGIFSVEEFERISAEDDAGIDPPQFGKLLEHLRIAAPFHMDGKLYYFFPCALAHTDEVPPHTNEAEIQSACKILPQLMITFKCGYCPKGIAGALVKYLMANEMKSQTSWKLICNSIFRNQVSFSIGPDKMILKMTCTHFEVTLLPDLKFPDRDKLCPLSRVCHEIHRAIVSGIVRITSDINFIKAEHSLTFACGCNGSHPGVLEFFDGNPYCLRCDRADYKAHLLPHGYEVWCIHESNFQTFRLTDRHHSSLLKQLTKHAAKWREIGIYLGFLDGELDNIQSKPLLMTNAPDSWLSAMLSEWLQWAPGDSRRFATLEGLNIALRDTGLAATAHDLSIPNH